MKSVLVFNALTNLMVQCETMSELEPFKQTITRMYDNKFLNENASSEDKRMAKELRKCYADVETRVYTKVTNEEIRKNFQ